MTTALLVIAAVGYAVVDLYAARFLYGTWRARSIDKDTATRFHDPVKWFNDTDKPFVMAFSLCAALVWPVTLVGWMAYRFFDATPVQSRRELESERDAMAARIAELERDLGIKRS